MAASGYCIDGAPLGADEVRQLITGPWIDLLDPAPGHRVLEVGCGAGLNLDALAAAGPAVGADLSAAMLAHYRGPVPVLVAAADQLPFGSGAFDRILVASVAHYFPSDAYFVDALAEWLRCLGPGGRVVVGDLLLAPARRPDYRWYRPAWLTSVAEGLGCRAELRPQSPAKRARIPADRHDLVLERRSGRD